MPPEQKQTASRYREAAIPADRKRGRPVALMTRKYRAATVDVRQLVKEVQRVNSSDTASNRHCHASVHRVTALLTTITIVVATFVTGTFTAQSASATTVESTFIAKLNHARAWRDIPRLRTRAILTEVAREQAKRMADRNTLYHNPSLRSDVPNWRWVGENVGYGPDAITIHVAFMHSPGHRANILDRDYTQVGVGAVVRDGRVWVAEVFRRPLR